MSVNLFRKKVAGIRRRVRLRLSYYRSRLTSYRPIEMTVLHPEFECLLPPTTTVERLATGFRFVEGPVWLAGQATLLFTDIPANKILRFTPSEQGGRNGIFSAQKISVFRQPSGHANGQALDSEGRLMCCEHSNRRVTLTEGSGAVMVLADAYGGQPLNSPNDLVMSRLGHLYFTDPSYGIAPNLQRQPVQGVYRLDADTQVLSCEIADIVAPNGLAFSPDERHLYLVDSSENRSIRIYDVGESGELTNGRLFAYCRSSSKAGPDGLTVDNQGNVFCAAGGGVWVFNDAGIHLGVIRLPETPSNCTWGGASMNELYITAESSLYRVVVQTNRDNKAG